MNENTKEIKIVNDEIYNKISKSFEVESYVMSRFATDNKIKAYFDFGCWYGILSEMLMKRLSEDIKKDLKVIAIDCVDSFLNIAYNNINNYCDSHNISTFCTTIVPESMKNSGVMIKVDNFNSLKTTICNREYDVNDDIIYISPTETLTIVEFFEKYFCKYKNIVCNSYIKIDLEGIDISVVDELLMKFKPRIIHFEVLNFQEFDSAIKILRNSRYKIPEHFVSQSEYYSIISSRSEAKLIGFNPDIVY